MSEWLKWLLIGIASVVFGVFALSNAVAASIAVTTLVGALFLVTGVFQIIAGFGESQLGSKIVPILLGVLMLLIGISFLANPLQGMISLALLVTILLAAGGLLRLYFAFQMRGTQFFWPMVIMGVISLLLAAYILANFEVASVSLLGILLGIELLSNGISLITVAFYLRAEGKSKTAS